jgi:hypothetical protein
LAEPGAASINHQLWQRRSYPSNVFTEEKRREKLNYMHNNPVSAAS